MTKQKANNLANTIIRTYNLDASEKNNLLNIFANYGVYKQNKFDNYEVVGQMDISDFPEYMPDEIER